MERGGRSPVAEHLLSIARWSQLWFSSASRTDQTRGKNREGKGKRGEEGKAVGKRGKRGKERR